MFHIALVRLKAGRAYCEETAMKVKIHKDTWLPPWLLDIVLPGHMLLRKKLSSERLARLYAHELGHVYQLKRLGSWGYVKAHLGQMIQYRSFWRYPLENEADEQENRQLTDLEMDWWIEGEIEL